jgi:hypothetical protein
MHKILPAIFLLLAFSVWVSAEEPAPSGYLNSTDDIPVAFSETGDLLLVTDYRHQGLTLVNLKDMTSTVITGGLNAGYHASFSPHGKYVCFKGFQDRGGTRYQASMLYSVHENKLMNLSSWQVRTGTPAVAADGKIAFTTGYDLVVLNPDFTIYKSIKLASYVNLLSFSVDCSKITYSDNHFRVHILEPVRGIDQTVTDGSIPCWNPLFSPDGNKVLASTVGGDVLVVDYLQKKTGVLMQQSLPSSEPPHQEHRLFKYLKNPVWLDNSTIAVLQYTVDSERNRISELCILDRNSGSVSFTPLGSRKANLLIQERSLFRIQEGLLHQGTPGQVSATYSDISWKSISPAVLTPGVLPSKVNMGIRTSRFLAKGAGASQETDPVVISNVPYLHQVWDTPDNFNGNWACNASSAVMALGYYHILPKNPVTCSGPESHISDYGFYVSEVYTFNGFTFNLGSGDPNGKIEYGGYGYITRNNWVDTKGYMRDFIRLHGAASEVDWSPSIAKAIREIDNRNPFVVLNSLSDVGHYITCIGYLKGSGEGTLIFNDPWGDKNDAQWRTFRSGIEVYYDWPGINNGYANLNNAACFIYCRATPPVFTGNLKGHVYFADNELGNVEENRIGGALIAVTDLSGEAVSTVVTRGTGADAGFFMFEELAPGRYRLAAEAEGFQTVEEEISISENEDTWKSIGLNTWRDVSGLVIGEGSFVASKDRIQSPSGEAVEFIYHAAENDRVVFEIYSVSGNLIKRIPGNSSRRVSWRGRDNNGRSVREGLYLVVMKTNGTLSQKKAGKISVLR